MRGCRRDWSSDVFFFQAEDGIRDYDVTGVQTCALPILRRNDELLRRNHRSRRQPTGLQNICRRGRDGRAGTGAARFRHQHHGFPFRRCGHCRCCIAILATVIVIDLNHRQPRRSSGRSKYPKSEWRECREWTVTNSLPDQKTAHV